VARERIDISMSISSRTLLTIFTGSTLALVPAVASAQDYSRWVVRVELGAGTMLHDFFHPPDTLDTSTLTGQLSARVAYRVVGPLGVQVGAGFGRFFQPDNRDDVPLIFGIGGLRVDPALGRIGRFWVDVNGGIFAVGTINRAGLDAGLGVEFKLSDTIALGPFGRYTRVFDGRYVPPSNMAGASLGASAVAGDVDCWVAGVNLAIYSLVDAPPPPPPPPPADSDNDGVTDTNDQCVNVPAGDHPDPARPGCPLSDEDNDGVYGTDDQCPTEPAGAHPNPERRGCPLSDEDNDGVYGTDDQCPTEPAGAHPNPERRGCPDGDGDRDGVFDHNDQCPTEAAGLHPDPARAGCPLPDRDRDNVPDATDACPDRPGAPSETPARNGCPGLLVVQDGAVRILRPVFFAPNRDTILPASFPVLNAVAEALRSMPEIRRLSVEGHTDDVGADDANLALSRRRAEAVVRWLSTTGRVDGARLTAEGFGETRPLQPVAGLTGRALTAARGQNRRVEFRITEIGH
jgi:outer membrane protein OmpA-like peptidoglycan-associated protein